VRILLYFSHLLATYCLELAILEKKFLEIWRLQKMKFTKSFLLGVALDFPFFAAKLAIIPSKDFKTKKIVFAFLQIFANKKK
jgi:uncharacterized membrane protein